MNNEQESGAAVRQKAPAGVATSYVRIWKKQGDRWQVVLDITNAH